MNASQLIAFVWVVPFAHPKIQSMCQLQNIISVLGWNYKLHHWLPIVVYGDRILKMENSLADFLFLFDFPDRIHDCVIYVSFSNLAWSDIFFETYFWKLIGSVFTSNLSFCALACTKFDVPRLWQFYCLRSHHLPCQIYWNSTEMHTLTST